MASTAPAIIESLSPVQRCWTRPALMISDTRPPHPPAPPAEPGRLLRCGRQRGNGPRPGAEYAPPTASTPPTGFAAAPRQGEHFGAGRIHVVCSLCYGKWIVTM